VAGGFSRSARAVFHIVMGVRSGDSAAEAGRLPRPEGHYADMEQQGEGRDERGRSPKPRAISLAFHGPLVPRFAGRMVNDDASLI